MIVGTVEDIKTVQVIKPIANSKKYKYEEQSILILKTEELEKLIVNANACGLADDLIIDEAKEKAAVEIKKEEAKVGESKPTKKKAKNNKKENTNKNTEEYEIIFSDQEIPAGYEEVKDEKLEKEISNKIEERANDVQKTADQIYLEELEKAQEKQRTIVVKEAVMEQETKKEEPKLIDELKTETKVAEEEKNIKMQNDDDLDVVKLLEEQKIKELEQNNKPIVEEKKKKQPEIKISKIKKVEIEKKEQEVEKPKDKITPDNFKPSGSMMKDVIEIISN
jgi:flagellar protein FlaD